MKCGFCGKENDDQYVVKVQKRIGKDKENVAELEACEVCALMLASGIRMNNDVVNKIQLDLIEQSKYWQRKLAQEKEKHTKKTRFALHCEGVISGLAKADEAIRWASGERWIVK